jgi:hypothetical protein
MMVAAATVFVVRDITKSIEHYRDALGFSVTFLIWKPTFYACLCRDEVALHLLAALRTHNYRNGVFESTLCACALP